MTHYLWMHALMTETPQANAARARRFNLMHAAVWMVYTRLSRGNVIARWEGWQ